MTSVVDADWLRVPRVRAVLDALEAEGGPDCARFVGGCVRDALIGRPVDDIDLATPLTPDRTVAALERAGLRAVPTGIEHGTVTAVSDHRPVEVTTLRRDVETDGRRAVVAFSTDWAEDAARRDFRLNALYADRQGRVHEPLPGGVADALAGRIVFVGEPETRIREDYLRILRFFRFRAWYGRGEPDAAGLEACAGLAEGLRTLSAERVSKELLKLLAADDPGPTVRLMAEVGVLARLLPIAVGVERLERLIALEPALGRPADPLLRLAALLPFDPDLATTAAAGLRLSRAETTRLAAALEPAPPALEGDAAPAAAYRLGSLAYADRVLLHGAEAGRPPRALRGALELADAWTRPRFPLGGADALALGAAGPEVGRALRAVEQAWVDRGFRDARDALMARLKAQLGV